MIASSWPRLAVVCLWAAWASAAAQPAPDAAPAAARPDPATLALHNRHVMTFRATLLGDTPAEREMMARAALEQVLERRGAGVVQRTPAGAAVRFQIDGSTVFFLVPDDLEGPRPESLIDAAAQKTEVRLRTALAEAREMRDPRRLAVGAASALGGTVVAWLVLRGLFALRGEASARLAQRIERLQDAPAAPTLAQAWAAHARGGARVGLSLLVWALVLLLADLWATFVLHQFAWTRPWGERSTAWLLDVLKQFALAAATAMPGLLTAVLIFALARGVTRANSLLMRRVERGELQLGWLDIDTAGPTRRLANFAIWLFALAMAYPYLPGAGSEAFKGVTVLAGLMLSLGASGVVGQAMSGLSLMYARALRVGEYVKIGDTEGTVTALGLFATKVHTGMGEEVSVPNTVVFSQPVRNFSRLVEGGQFVLQATVTIGYATPWRQVHAMLMEAARRTPGVDQDPSPFVVQTALSDFYVEYRLCARGNKAAPRRRAEAMNALHANIQDVFAEQGVQIMSPHYRADPPAPQVPPVAPQVPPRR